MFPIYWSNVPPDSNELKEVIKSSVFVNAKKPCPSKSSCIIQNCKIKTGLNGMNQFLSLS